MILTHHFSLQEFESKDGLEMPRDAMENVFKLADNLQIIRNEIGSALHINSAYRSPTHNASIGGVKDSQHIKGKAADIISRKHSPKELYDIIDNLISLGRVDIKGMGLYKSFVHVDIRESKARWDNS